MCAHEFNVLDFDLWRFGNFIRNGGAAGALIRRNRIFHIRLAIAGFLVSLFDFLRVGEQFAFVQRITHFRFYLLTQFAHAEFFIPAESDVGDPQFRLQNVS